MAQKRKRTLRKYRFKIDAYTRETMPLGRLAEYLTELAVMLGEEKSVHLIEVEDGSCVPVFLVEPEAEPKILERADAIKRKEAPPEAMKAAANIDEKLRKDNGKAEFVGPKDNNLIIFPALSLKMNLRDMKALTTRRVNMCAAMPTSIHASLFMRS